MSFKHLELLLSLPKSIYVCLRLLPFKHAIHLPILVRYNVKCLSLSGTATANGCFASIRIGFGNIGAFDKTYERTILQIEGKLILNSDKRKGKILFGHGSRIIVTEGGRLEIGHSFANTAMMTIICTNEIVFGHNVTTSWNTLIMDTDFHALQNIQTGEIYNLTKPICIGDNVWLCTRSVLLKGSVIPSGCVVGANAVVSKQYKKKNTLIAGNPAKEIKEHIIMYNGTKLN